MLARSFSLSLSLIRCCYMLILITFARFAFMLRKVIARQVDSDIFLSQFQLAMHTQCSCPHRCLSLYMALSEVVCDTLRY